LTSIYRYSLFAALFLAVVIGCRGSSGGSNWLRLPNDWLFGTWQKKAEEDKVRTLEDQKQALESENRNLQARLNELATAKELAEDESARLAEELAVGRPQPTRLASSPGQSNRRGRAGQSVPERRVTDVRQLDTGGELLEYDSHVGGCRLARELAFEDSKLPPQSQWVLNDFAKAVRNRAPRDARVLIISRNPAGQGGATDDAPHGDEASAVARYLVDEGLGDEQIAFLAVQDDPRAAEDGEGETTASSPVAVYIMPADRLTVGWETAITRKLR
jgi:hypothetical protein